MKAAAAAAFVITPEALIVPRLPSFRFLIKDNYTSTITTITICVTTIPHHYIFRLALCRKIKTSTSGLHCATVFRNV